MILFLLKAVLILSLGQFFVPKKWKYFFTFSLHLTLVGISSILIFNTFNQVASLKFPFLSLLNNTIYIEIDKLSAFFMFVINFTCLTGIIYAKAYLEPYYKSKSSLEFALHYFSFLWLHIAMLFVVMFRDALAFLIVWEIMALTAFLLVIFENEKKETIKIGIQYMVQMHIAVVFIMIGFIWAYSQTGAEFSFDGLSVYFESHNPLPLFLIFFIGFGIKAGFIPLHSWLPHAHPAAPTHVSAVMSGVIIKMAIYGILRVLTYIHHDLFNIGLFILIGALVNGLIGVSLAIVQHDIKKLLAYHSIENIGIIGIGIGLGVIGLAINIPALAVLGFAGGILHILNHSLFKSLLFYTAGAVYTQTHTRNIEELGGLIKKMPKTALFFLIGALAICGLPPFNGFISEFLIYSGMFKALLSGDLQTDMLLLFAISGLAIIGGLAIFCFTKVFSIVFLGTPRSDKVTHAKEASTSMILSYALIAITILLIGLLPVIFINPLIGVVSIFTTDTQAIQQAIPTLNSISISSGLFIVLIALFWLVRAWQQKRQNIRKDATWACAYTGANLAIHQYTATSYADNFVQISKQITNVKKEFKDFEETEVFPKERTFQTHSSDKIEDYLITAPTDFILNFLQKIGVFQTGKIQHYLLYAFAFIAMIFILTLLNLI